MRRAKIGLFILLLILGFVLRLYRFDNPIADWHSWRQADTSSVSREFVKNGFDLLHPKYHDLSSQTGGRLPNPQGFRFVEFPIYNLLQGGFFSIFGIFTLEQWGRFVSIFFLNYFSCFYFSYSSEIFERYNWSFWSILLFFFAV